MSLRIVLFCLVAGLAMTLAGAGSGSTGLWYVSGIFLVAAFVPFLVKGPVEHWKRFASAWCALAAITVLCTWSEAVIFVPAFRQQNKTVLLGGMFMYTVLAGVMTLCSGLLKLRPSGPQEPVAHRGLGGIVAGVLGAGLSYAVYYYIFGSITFQFFTRSYYSGATPLANAIQVVHCASRVRFPLIQFARGTIMTLGALPDHPWHPVAALAVWLSMSER
jgi:hypothetical protein